MNRWAVWLALIMILAGLWTSPAGAEPGPGQSPPTQTEDPSRKLIQEQLQTLDTSELQAILDQVNREMEGYLPEMKLGDIIGSVTDGGPTLDLSGLLRGMLRYLFREVVANWALLGQLIILAVICAVLQNLQSAFDSEATGKVAYTVCYLVLVILAITSFAVAIGSARGIIDRLVSFMLALLPTLLALLAGMGGITSAGIFHPLMIAATHLVSTVIVNVVFPLLFLAAILEIISGINENFKVTGLAALFRQGSLTLLGLGFSLFLGVMAVKGAAGAVADGVTLRTGKFLANTFIPVVGKMFSDAAELVIGSSLLIKNAIGAAGAAAIFFIVIFPLLKIVSIVLIYRLAASLIQPVGGTPIVNCLNSIANSLTLVCVSVAVAALMFFVAVTVIIGAGNMTVMMR